MKQTAVEWLVEQLIPKAFVTYDNTTYNAIKQAKQMEKEQIIYAYDDGCEERHNHPVNGTEYYNETYNK